MIIEVFTHGASIHKKRERFVIKIPNEKDQEISAQKTDAILVSSNAMISTAAMKLCVERQIQLVITSYTGQPIARMWSSAPGRQTQLRRQQYLNYDTKFAFTLTKQLLHEKLTNQKNYLSQLKQNRKDTILTRRLADTISFMDKTIHKLDEYNFKKNYAQTFLGFEGICAQRYFESLSACLPKRWQFEKRTQNPGLDEFNACLNYLYGMAYVSIEKIVIISGLDPNAGFYHKDHYGKPTLVYDIIEPYRPIMDKSLVYLFNRRMVKDNWFSEYQTKISHAVELSKEGRFELISIYKNNCLSLIERQAWQQCREITKDLLILDRFGKNLK